MNQPQRIQLRRTKGWRMPENTISVARPSRWGNPYRALPTADGWSVFAGKIEYWIERVGIVSREEAVAEAIRLYRLGMVAWAEDEYSDDEDVDPLSVAFAPLRGKNLACYCDLGAPCHADVLLELANRGGAAANG